MSWRISHPSTLVERWALQGSGASSFGRYPGTPANMTGWPASGPKNSLTCGEFDGDDSNINVGDVTQLNAVSALTLCFWMNQDVLDVDDRLFLKTAGGSNFVSARTFNDGNCYLYVENGAASFGTFDYSVVIAAASWAHVAMVFDGTQTGDANRLIVYVDGNPVTLGFPGAAIPATTPDLSAQDFYIGHTSDSFDGRLWDFRLYNVPLSRDEVNRIIHQPAPLV